MNLCPPSTKSCDSVYNSVYFHKTCNHVVMQHGTLAKQLKKLQIPGQSGLLEKESRRKPSLLFTTQEAANLDIDSIHALGVNGLEELITLQPAFSEFTESLFAESCKHFERSIEVQSVVKELDNLIAKFLRLLSPYFLLHPSHKCLEWLIRAFRIHECNIDVILECILPYYETNLLSNYFPSEAPFQPGIGSTH